MDELEYNRIRKSLYMAWKICPRQAYYTIRSDNYEQYNEFNISRLSLLFGQIFHKEMDSFYSKLDLDTMIELSSDFEGLYNYICDKFSITTNEICLDYFAWYAAVEARRFIDLYSESKTGIMQRFFPLYIEKFVEYKDEETGLYRNGHFDRIDYIGPNQLRLVEYKTGQSYDVTKSYKLTKLRSELYWYKEIIENIEEFKDYNVVEWMLINPTTKTVYTSKFSPATKTMLNKDLPKLANDLNGENPPDRNINLYCGSCEFKQDCLINIDFNIFDGLYKLDDNSIKVKKNG